MVHTARTELLIWRAALPLAVLFTTMQLATMVLAVPFLLALAAGLVASVGAAAIVERGGLRDRGLLATTLLGASVAMVLMPLVR
jgi:hypothetical protein